MLDDIMTRIQAAEWQVDTLAFGQDAWLDLHMTVPVTVAMGEPVRLFGMPVRIDPTLDPDVIELRYGERVAGRIEGLNVQHEPRRISRIGTNVNERPDGEAPTQRRYPATGPTTRLVCSRCGDTPPAGARFCIQCGAAL
jgi:hypothetical protein